MEHRTFKSACGDWTLGLLKVLDSKIASSINFRKVKTEIMETTNLVICQKFLIFPCYVSVIVTFTSTKKQLHDKLYGKILSYG